MGGCSLKKNNCQKNSTATHQIRVDAKLVFLIFWFSDTLNRVLSFCTAFFSPINCGFTTRKKFLFWCKVDKSHCRSTPCSILKKFFFVFCVLFRSKLFSDTPNAYNNAIILFTAYAYTFRWLHPLLILHSSFSSQKKTDATPISELDLLRRHIASVSFFFSHKTPLKNYYPVPFCAMRTLHVQFFCSEKRVNMSRTTKLPPFASSISQENFKRPQSIFEFFLLISPILFVVAILAPSNLRVTI